MQKVLVAGGAGFIGSHIVEKLVGSGHGVTVVDNFSTGRRENLPASVDVVQADICDTSAMQKLTSQATAVIHLAAHVGIRDSFVLCAEDARTNVLGTISLLQACAESPVKKFIFASTMAVYADRDSPEPVPESHPAEPLSPYGISKLAGEKFTLVLCRQLGIQSLVLRYFNAYGPRQALNPYVGVITIFIDKLLRGECPTVYGDGNQVRDFVAVEDVAHATLLALESNISGEVLNIGSGHGTSLNTVARLVLEKINPALSTVHEPEQPGELRFSIADIAKARTMIGYEPSATITDHIDRIIECNKETPLS